MKVLTLLATDTLAGAVDKLCADFRGVGERPRLAAGENILEHSN